MKLLKIIAAALVGTALIAAAGCGGNEQKTSSAAASAAASGTKKVLKYRRMPTATSDLMEAGIKPIMEKKGYKLEGVGIKDSIQREMALDEGQIDFHVDAHEAWIQAVNKSKGTKLMAILPLPTVPTGLYGGNKKTLEEVAPGDTIIMPNDASNVARSYQLLDRLGWVKLNPNKDRNQVTGSDVIENPKNLVFKEMKGPTIYGVKDDAAYIILRGSDAYNAKLDFNTVLFPESAKDMNDKMRIALCIAEKNKDEQWVKDLIAAYKSPEFKEFMKTQGSFWILPPYMTDGK